MCSAGGVPGSMGDGRGRGPGQAGGHDGAQRPHVCRHLQLHLPAGPPGAPGLLLPGCGGSEALAYNVLHLTRHLRINVDNYR